MRATASWSVTLMLLTGVVALAGQQTQEIRIEGEAGSSVFMTRSIDGADAAGVPGRGGTRTVPVGTAVLSGVVSAEGSGRPLANVRLAITSTDTEQGRGGPVGGGRQQVMAPVSRTAVSDERGRFLFDALPAGRFMLTGTKDQYLTATYGAAKPQRPGVAIPLDDGQRLNVALSMVRGGVISGTLTGEDGEPVVRAMVRASRVTYTNGVKRVAAQNSVQTDDRGMFRMSGLIPGEYYVAAARGFESSAGNMAQARAEVEAFTAALAAAREGGRTPATVTYPAPPGGLVGPSTSATYYPGVVSISSASAITIVGGDEKAGVDFGVVPISTVDITGIVANMPEGAPRGRVMVTLVNRDPLADSSTSVGTSPTPDGNFTIRSVPPGTYELFAQVLPTGAGAAGGGGFVVAGGPATASATNSSDSLPALWGRGTIVVTGQPLPSVVITLQPSRSISGTVVVEGGMRPTGTVMLMPDPLAPLPRFPVTPARVAADGTFSITGVPGGRYLVQVPGGQRAKSAVLNGVDVLDAPLDFEGDRDISGLAITLTTQTSRLSGTVTDAGGAPAPAYTIIVAPADRTYWLPGARRVRITRPDLNGRYVINGLPAGEYLLAAVTDLEPGRQFDPEFLKELAAAAISVTVTDDGQQTRDVRVSR